ncbi:NUDIX domain-containing protein [Paracoccus beibuensis]|uniref:NUDIX domain-containing protein n=1 Tax=Paracoccus beibuensis TaxID=547602 RepID=UPI002240A184|nr:NUDIX hydrolase [Paracoccus beibuensis]
MSVAAHPRLAVRAAILHQARVLMVNAYPDRMSDLWCLPGGGVEPAQSLHDNLVREVAEETGLSIRIGALFLVNEFHDPTRGFHQIELHFRATPDGPTDLSLKDPEGVVNRARWVTQDDLRRLRHKPDALADAIWSPGGAHYDRLETIVL